MITKLLCEFHFEYDVIGLRRVLELATTLLGLSDRRSALELYLCIRRNSTHQDISGPTQA